MYAAGWHFLCNAVTRRFRDAPLRAVFGRRVEPQISPYDGEGRQLSPQPRPASLSAGERASREVKASGRIGTAPPMHPDVPLNQRPAPTLTQPGRASLLLPGQRKRRRQHRSFVVARPARETADEGGYRTRALEVAAVTSTTVGEDR